MADASEGVEPGPGEPGLASAAADDPRLAALLAHSSDIITILDATGKIRYGSPATTRILGYETGANLGKDMLTLLHPEDRDRAIAALIENLAAGPGAVKTIDVRVARANGDWCHLEVVASNHLDDPAIAGIILNSRDVTDRVAALEELRHAAQHDRLTGLPNRTLLFDRMAQALARASRAAADLTVFYLDLDGFKDINDRHGHAVGDTVLREVAQRLPNCIRSGDTAARVGGDEFVVVAENIGPSEALSMADRIIAGVTQPIGPVSGAVEVGISVGISFGRGTTADELLARADRALYDVKRNGGRHFRVDQTNP